MGRTVDKIWTNWTTIDTNKVNCIYCKTCPQQRHATKCKKHTSICSKAPIEIRKQFKQEIETSKLQSVSGVTRNDNSSSQSSQEIFGSQSEDDEIRRVENNISTAEYPDSSAGSSVSCGRQSNLNAFINKVSKQKNKELQVLFTKALISGDVAFRFSSNYFLKQFFEKLGSGFLPPSRREITGSILKKLEEDTNQTIANEISNQKNLTIVPDGWQNVRGVSVINIMLVNPKSCIFYKSFETGKD